MPAAPMPPDRVLSLRQANPSLLTSLPVLLVLLLGLDFFLYGDVCFCLFVVLVLKTGDVFIAVT